MENVFSDSVLYYDTNVSCPKVQLKEDLNRILRDVDLNNVNLVILCIGTDRATGDCLGPLVGERLKNINSNIIVIGDLKSPIHALNISSTIENIYRNIENPFVIAVDAALGNVNHIGYITLSREPIAPGKGVNKKLPAIGDISITGIVNIAGRGGQKLLQNTRLSMVMDLADCIAFAISNACLELIYDS